MTVAADGTWNRSHDCFDGHREECFSYYDAVFVPLSANASGRKSMKSLPEEAQPLDQPHSQQQPHVMEVRCMESLTPLDMLDLSNGLSDATGNRIWMGAVLFMECMVRELLPQKRPAITKNCTIHHTHTRTMKRNNTREGMPLALSWFLMS